MKTCNKCGSERPLDQFSRHARSKDGLQSDCKPCQAARNAASYAANRERVAAQGAVYYAANRERVAARKAVYYAANRERVAARAAAYAKTHPENRAAVMARHRARKAGAAGTFTAEQWLARLAYHGGKCFYCKTTEDIQIEHRIPLSRGGTNWPSNLVPACKSCNCKKWTKTEKEYLTFLRNHDTQNSFHV